MKTNNYALQYKHSLTKEHMTKLDRFIRHRARQLKVPKINAEMAVLELLDNDKDGLIKILDKI